MSHQLPRSATGESKRFCAVIPFDIEGCRHLNLAISTMPEGLAGIDYVDDIDLQDPDNAIAENVVHQLLHYFNDPQRGFDLPLALRGTPFQQRLWKSLCSVPAGQTDTYGHLATELNSGAQAIGQACRRNPVPVIVPCHRIVSLQGMGGYAGEINGEKIRIKKALLAHEGYILG